MTLGSPRGSSMKLKELLRSPALLVLAAAVLVPLSLPLLFFLLPFAAVVGALVWLSSHNSAAPAAVEIQANPLPVASTQSSQVDGAEEERRASIAAKSNSAVAAPILTPPPKATPILQKPPTAAATAAAAPKSQTSFTAAPKSPTAAAKAGAEAPAPKAVGGAAILARLRAQKAARAAAEAETAKAKEAAKGLTVLYASQLGTAAEIAKNIHAEAESRGVKSRLASMNELGFDNLSAEATPVVVMVSSTTGDGDPPDNAAKFYMTLKRKSLATNRLEGIQFTCLGLGDSNYTRYMAVPRVLKNRFTEMGARVFYDPCEADEVDGLEEIVDKWTEGLWPAVVKATASAPAADGKSEAVAQQNGGAADGGLPAGVPPLPKQNVRLEWAAKETADKIAAQEAHGPTQAELAHRDASGMYSPEAPYWAGVSGARLLTTPAAGDRRVIHLQLDVAGSGMEPLPGDSIGVLPVNSDALVDALVSRLMLDPFAVFSVARIGEESSPAVIGDSAAPLGHLRWPCTVRAALHSGCDLTSPPRKSLLRILAEHCSAAADKARLLHLCSRDGRAAYAADILAARPTLLDLLTTFPSCTPPLDALLEALPPLPPRMYSIANSAKATPGRVEVAFTTVRYDTASGEREGVATSWLERSVTELLSGEEKEKVFVADGEGSASQPRMPVFLRRGGDFEPPKDLTAPWILIGPGTGVAPFRGFLQERCARLAEGEVSPADAGECWLYFGCRAADQDFLFEDDLKGFVADGTLSRLEVAFSRAKAEKVYVQHLMAQHAHQLHDLIVGKKGYVFVCGDGARMAGDVQATLVKIMAEHGGLAEVEAAAKLANMAKEGRYVRDIWS